MFKLIINRTELTRFSSFARALGTLCFIGTLLLHFTFLTSVSFSRRSSETQYFDSVMRASSRSYYVHCYLPGGQVQFDPSSVQHFRWKGTTAELAASVRACSSVEPPPLLLWSWFIHRAALAYLESKYSECNQYASAALKLQPDNADALVLLILSDHSAGESGLHDLADHASRLLLVSPRSASSYLAKEVWFPQFSLHSTFNRGIGDMEAIQARLEAIAHNCPTAEKLADSLLRSLPTNSNAWEIKGACSLDNNDGTTAYADLQKAAFLMPSDPLIHSDLARYQSLYGTQYAAQAEIKRAWIDLSAAEHCLSLREAMVLSVRSNPLPDPLLAGFRFYSDSSRYLSTTTNAVLNENDADDRTISGSQMPGNYQDSRLTNLCSMFVARR